MSKLSPAARWVWRSNREQEELRIEAGPDVVTELGHGLARLVNALDLALWRRSAKPQLSGTIAFDPGAECSQRNDGAWRQR